MIFHVEDDSMHDDKMFVAIADFMVFETILGDVFHLYLSIHPGVDFTVFHILCNCLQYVEMFLVCVLFRVAAYFES